jgi:organic hydroperoxide reductase OsmC/OhrA
MSAHHATIHWRNSGNSLGYEEYSRDHEWTMKEGTVRIAASAAPAYRGSEGTVDPEDALVAALASCHMLTFLAIAARRRLIVMDYRDAAEGVLESVAGGPLWMTRVTLRPQVRFAQGAGPSADEFTRLHQKAHEQCFIANSVKTEVRCEPVLL